MFSFSSVILFHRYLYIDCKTFITNLNIQNMVMKYLCKFLCYLNCSSISTLFFVKKTFASTGPTSKHHPHRPHWSLNVLKEVKFTRGWKNMKVIEKSDTTEKRWNGKGHGIGDIRMHFRQRTLAQSPVERLAQEPA